MSFDISFSELLLHRMTFFDFWKKALDVCNMSYKRPIPSEILPLPLTGNDRSFFFVSTFGWDLRDSQACYLSTQFVCFQDPSHYLFIENTSSWNQFA